MDSKFRNTGFILGFYSLSLIIATNSVVPLFDQKLINILLNTTAAPLLSRFVEIAKPNPIPIFTLEYFFSHQALIQWFACSNQAVDTLHTYHWWRLLIAWILSYSLLRLQPQTSRQVGEPALKHYFGDRIVAETEQFSLRNLQLSLLNPWYGGRVGKRKDREGKKT